MCGAAAFRCLGSFDDEGLVDPRPQAKPVGHTLNAFVGDCVGEQIAGFNAVAVVPAPPAGLLTALGLAPVLAAVRRGRARRRGP